MRHLLLLTLLLPIGIAHAADATDAANATPGIDGVQRQHIQAGNFFYKPNWISVQAGKPVELMIEVEPGVRSHRFVLRDEVGGLNIDQDLDKDGTFVRFTPMVAGRYLFYCNKRSIEGSHQDQGMQGVLEVLAPEGAAAKQP